MDNSFFVYLQQLELMAFFSGYPLLYAILYFFAGNQHSKKIFTNIVRLLPFGYALVGTLCLGLQLKKLYPDYSWQHISSLPHPYLISWGLLSILFWVPVVAKKKVLSLLHSLVFFFFLARDLVLQVSSHQDKSIIRNDMNVYTTSLLLNLGAFALIVLLSFLFTRHKNV